MPEERDLIGWRPYLLSLLAVGLVVLVVIDVHGTLSHASTCASAGCASVGVAKTKADRLATIANWLHGALGEVVNILTHLSVLDWILLGAAVYAVWWGWARALSFARLGAIQIMDLATDDVSLDPVAAKAELQEQFAKRGLVPPSGVPSGSPTVASVAAAITAAPIPQANWLGVLIGLLPTPPTSTGFQVSATLLPPQDPDKYVLVYQLVRTGPRTSVTFDRVAGADRATLLDAASKAIFRKIGDAAPAIYPRWSRWSSSDALTKYRAGVDLEQGNEPDDEAGPLLSVNERYRRAGDCYREASRLDPDNMLARLRLANCLERLGSDIDDDSARVSQQFEALLEYMSIRVRHPTIFEAGFRASVLLIGLAGHAQEILDTHDGQLRILRQLLERAMRRDRETAGWTPRILFYRPKWLRRKVTMRRPTDAPALEEMLDRAARRESKLARLRLRPLYLMVNETRFRHRFESTGQERRQLRKSLGISRIAMRARRAARKPPRGPAIVFKATQLCWVGWVFWRYMFGRSHVAGWQAHYNAACFYALLPLADDATGRLARRVRRRGLSHLRRAIDQAPDGALPAVYVRDEDRDLRVLREQSNDFQRIVRRLCPDQLTIRYWRPVGDEEWELEVRGDVDAVETALLSPIRVKQVSAIINRVVVRFTERVYQIKILDETKPLTVVAHRDDAAPVGEENIPWDLVPAQLDTSEVWVFPADGLVYKRRPPPPYTTA